MPGAEPHEANYSNHIKRTQIAALTQSKDFPQQIPPQSPRCHQATLFPLDWWRSLSQKLDLIVRGYERVITDSTCQIPNWEDTLLVTKSLIWRTPVRLSGRSWSRIQSF